MGMDLIGAGFTRRTDKKCDLSTIDSLIDAIPDEKFQDDAFLNAIDPSEYLGSDANDAWEDVRDALKEGAREYDSAIYGNRSTVDFGIQGTALQFIFAGGDSYGDDPYEGFGSLCLFINLCAYEDGIREAAGYVCGGLPGAWLVALYAEGN